MNKTFKILTLIFVLSAIIFAEESNEKRSLDTVQQIFKALENKDINEFSKFIHPLSYYGANEVGAKQWFTELSSRCILVSVKYIGHGEMRDYVEVCVVKSGENKNTASNNRFKAYEIISLGHYNGKQMMFSCNFTADASEK